MPSAEPDEAAAPAAEDPGGGQNENTNVWPDEAAEMAFLTDARDKGENPGLTVAAAFEAAEEADTQALPPLEELVKRIPPEVREALDDLFRVKFTAVRRVPKKVLKG